MKTIQFSIPNRPGAAHIGSVEMRAESALDAGIISALPKIKVERSSLKGFWVVILECMDKDRPFWMGFYMGIDFSKSNLQLIQP